MKRVADALEPIGAGTLHGRVSDSSGPLSLFTLWGLAWRSRAAYVERAESAPHQLHTFKDRAGLGPRGSTEGETSEKVERKHDNRAIGAVGVQRLQGRPARVLPGVNIFLGANATGKSHAMKALYAPLKTLEQNGGTTVPLEARLREKLANVFKPDDGFMGRLVRRRKGQSQGKSASRAPRGRSN